MNSLPSRVWESEDVRGHKKIYETGVSHPAPYSNALFPIFEEYLDGFENVFDPFAGTGKIHRLRQQGWVTVGLEIEPEWANLSPHTYCGDVFDLPWPWDRGQFDAICTSPCYGNRLADHHNAKDGSLRRSYKHDLNRDPHENSSATLHWGDKYRHFHLSAWEKVLTVLDPRGRFILNIKDHIRGGERMPVSDFHCDALVALGLEMLAAIEVETPGLRYGENRELRCPEMVYVFDRKEVLD